MFSSITRSTFNLVLSISVTGLAALTISCAQGAPPSNTSSTSPSAASAPAGEFEGTIAMKMEDEGQKQAAMTFFLKGRNTRIEAHMDDSPDGRAVMLMDVEGEKVTTLMPARKIYMTMNLKETVEGLAKGTKSSDEEETKFPKLSPTGKQETIAGHTCEHWLLGDEQELDVCIAKGLGYFALGGQGGLAGMDNLAFSPKMLANAAPDPQWKKFLEGGAFPLKITATENGQVTMKMEVTRIEKKSLDDGLFVIPPDYKELKMPSMTGGKQ